MIIFLRKWILRIAYAVMYPLPVRPRVVFASGHATRLGGNLKALYDEIEQRALGIEVVTLVRTSAETRTSKLDTLLFALRAEYYLATSTMFVVDDYFFPLYVIRLKPQTTVIQTWHASGAFKKIGYSVINKTFGASPSLVRQVKIHSNYTYCLIASHTAVPAYAEAFGQPAERFVSLGVPRTDVFFDPEFAARAEKLRAKYSLPPGKKTVLYAPTFRGDSKHSAAYHDDLDLHELQAACGNEYVVLLRLHPFVAAEVEIDDELAGFVIDVSRHPDINELLLISDLLVTDYSSTIYEYSLLGRPMAFFAPDFEAYQAERGFYFDYESGVPGPVFTTTTGLAEYLSAGMLDVAAVEEFRSRSFDLADGHASERVVDTLILPAVKP